MDFTTIINRANTHAVKWEALPAVYRRPVPENTLPMWVADMDFLTAPTIIEALNKRVQHGIFGYTQLTSAIQEAIVQWQLVQHQWAIRTTDLLFHTGVIPALASSIQACLPAHSTVAMVTPIYPPFVTVLTRNHHSIVRIPFDLSERTLPLKQIEAAFTKGVQAFILCNPHNPAGIVWNKDELSELIQLCRDYKVLLISDEIHADLVYAPAKHIPIASLATRDDRIITLNAPTKTFNLAGIQIAYSICSNSNLQTAIQTHQERQFTLTPSVFSLTAIEAAYTVGKPWLEELLQQLQTNQQIIKEHLQKAKVDVYFEPVEATYLAWFDCRKLICSEKEVLHALLDAGVAVDPGSKYGEEGRGFLRVNFACSPLALKEALHRMIPVFQKYTSK